MNQPGLVTVVGTSSNRGFGWRSPELSPGLGQRLVAQTSFLRSVDLPFATVASELRRRGNRTGPGAFVDLGPALSMGQICVESDVAHVGVVIHRRWGPVRRSVPMDLELSPLPGRHPFTRMEMVARQRVRSGRRYFRAGHRALDALVTELVREDATRDDSSVAPLVGQEEPYRLAG